MAKVEGHPGHFHVKCMCMGSGNRRRLVKGFAVCSLCDLGPAMANWTESTEIPAGVEVVAFQ